MNTKNIALKTMFLNALDKVGGIDYLVKQANENPVCFMSAISKLIPIDVDITKTQINISVGMYPEEQHEQHKPTIAQEAVESVH